MQATIVFSRFEFVLLNLLETEILYFIYLIFYQLNKFFRIRICSFIVSNNDILIYLF